MTDTIALLSHTSPTAIVAYRAGLAVTVQQFLDEAKQVAQRLARRADHVLNVCADRYQFAVGLAACLMSERVSLLPSTHTPQVIATTGWLRARRFLSDRRSALRHRSAAGLLPGSGAVPQANRR